jgi:hypothetical protein
VPWQSGHYYSLSDLLINSVVPAESGVFAIYATREQIFIAESGNLRRALLGLHTDMMRFGFYCATGFTFELCPAASRLKRLKQLLREHERLCHEHRHNHVLYG